MQSLYCFLLICFIFIGFPMLVALGMICWLHYRRSLLPAVAGPAKTEPNPTKESKPEPDEHSPDFEPAPAPVKTAPGALRPSNPTPSVPTLRPSGKYILTDSFADEDGTILL